MLKFYGLMEQLKEAGLKEFLFLAHTLLKDRAFALVAFIDEYNPLTHRAYDNQVRLSRLWPPAVAGWTKVSLPSGGQPGGGGGGVGGGRAPQHRLPLRHRPERRGRRPRQRLLHLF